MILGITIHNTGNELSARDNYRRLEQLFRTNLCHYLVDEKEVIQTTQDTDIAYHTGKGYDLGNKYTLAVEICRSTCEDDIYLKAEKKAISLIKKLMKKYELKRSDIYFHCDFDEQARCPHRILEKYKNKEEFLNGYKF